MKSSLVLGLYAAILALTLHESQAWIHEKLFRKQADAETTTVDTEQDSFSDNGICNDYWRLRKELIFCINVGASWRNSYSILPGLTTMCKNKESIRQCMVDKIVSCEANYNELVHLLDRGLGYCVGDEVPMDVRHYLEDLEADNLTLTTSCLFAVFDFSRLTGPKCNVSIPNPRMTGNMTEAAEGVDSLFWWMHDCMMGTNLTEVAGNVCGNVTRGQVYGLRISGLPLYFGFGINHYAKFEAFKLAHDGPGYF